MRGIAAVSVMLYHFTERYRSYFGHVFPSSYDAAYGHYGVQLFFMISGFVIFMSVAGSGNALGFAYKRFFRLYPAYWVCLSLTFAVSCLAALGIGPHTPETFAVNLTMLQGLTRFRHIDGSYWTLLPELMFYLLIFVLMVVRQLKYIRVVGVCWLALVFVNGYFYKFELLRVFLNLQYGQYFYAGILFYLLSQSKGNKWGLYLELLATYGLAIVPVGNFELTHTLIIAAFYTLFFLLIMGKLDFLSTRPLLFLGSISYPLYLLHQNIGYAILNWIKPFYSGYPVIIVPVAVSIGLAYLARKYVEYPMYMLAKAWYLSHIAENKVLSRYLKLT